MNRLLPVLALLLMPVAGGAVTGGKPARDPEGLRRQVVRVENSLGELCTGVLVAPDIVLTAAHCLALPVRYRVTVLDGRFKPRNIAITAIERHPAFVPSQLPRKQTGTDLALIRLKNAAPADMQPVRLGAYHVPQPGAVLYLAGFGSTSYGNVHSARTLRIAELTVLATRQPPNRITIAADPSRQGRSSGAGACRGDSGGPVFIAAAEGNTVAGIVSWAARAEYGRDDSPCGGFTAITPLAPHADWIARGIDRLRRMR